MKAVKLYIGKHTCGYVVSLNNYLVKGSFPNSANPIMETQVSMESIASAFTPTELREMLEYCENLPNWKNA